MDVGVSSAVLCVGVSAVLKLKVAAGGRSEVILSPSTPPACFSSLSSSSLPVDGCIAGHITTTQSQRSTRAATQQLHSFSSTTREQPDSSC